jgi:hypothetical protein
MASLATLALGVGAAAMVAWGDEQRRGHGVTGRGRVRHPEAAHRPMGWRPLSGPSNGLPILRDY